MDALLILDMKNTHLYKIIAILLPFILLLLIEGGLRIFNYGYRYDLFVEYPESKGYLVFNPHASKKYFTDPNFAPGGNSEFFKKEKDANTIRFFVLGASTSIGYPYFHNGSFHRWLLYRLMHSYPEKNIEIINLSLTAVNSYTIKGFTKELINYEPDGVLIYAGQNEYYGGLGVASTQTIGGNPGMVNMILEMRQLRLIQLLMNGYQNIGQLVKKDHSEGERTRMELMVGDQQIPYQSELFEKGIHQFRYNMNATLSILHKENIPVFFSNLVSNIKDLPPFISDEKDTDNALHYYTTAQSFYQEGEYQKAKDYFIKAKEADLLRFRAPEELNKIIEELCNQYPNAHFVDSKGELEKHSPHQILGDELFTDHVHPNIKGYSLLSNAFYNKMKESNILPQTRQEVSEEQLWSDMPVSPLDSIAGEFRIMKLKGHWPFYDSLYIDKQIPENTLEEKLAARLFKREEDWLTVHNTLYTAYLRLNQTGKAIKVAEVSVLEYSEDAAFYENAGMIIGESGNRELAIFYLKKSFELVPAPKKAHYLTVFYLMIDDPASSVPYLNYDLANNNRGLNAIKPLLETVIKKKQQLTKEPENTSLMIEIANTYLQMDNKNGAVIYVRKILAIDPANKEALALKNKLM